jgi:hypothetical protein
MTTYKMRFYDTQGNTAGEVTGLTIEEVNTIYDGCRSILKKEGNSLGFNAWMPTVWNEETGAREAGY